MGLRKSSCPTISGKENLTWTISMDDAFVNAFVNEHDCGNKVILKNIGDSIDVDNNIFSFSAQHPSTRANTETTSTKRKKEDATKDKAPKFEIIIGAIDNVATALREENELFKDMYCRKVFPISGEEHGYYSRNAGLILIY
ncbi:tryptophan 5-hydroxylase 1 [Striga asiatica]|uniref:Tryptophan 5-hydroxylase 1 n=1 Tax=Striga asiatica TaxID=4170 RepID=A0A5A7QN93_STRAF|nr:tryptophan 5-hydroxylase 1 [Striga asiatica]